MRGVLALLRVVPLVLVTGCWPFAWGFVKPTGQALPAERTPDLARARQLEITACEGGGIPGTAVTEYCLVLRSDGPCRGAVGRGTNGTSERQVRAYDLPPEVFAEAVAVVQDTAFFGMASVAPDVLFESGGSWVKVNCDGCEHLVGVLHPAALPPGYARIYAFATGIEKRGKPVGEPAAALEP